MQEEITPAPEQEAEVQPAPPAPESDASQWLRRNRNWIIIVALALAGIGFWIFNSITTAQERDKEARDQMYVSVRLFERDSFRLALEGDSTTQYPGFLQLLEDYGDTPAGNLMRYYTGIALIRSGRFAESIGHLEKFDKPENMVGMVAYGALAVAYEEVGQWENASVNYLAAAHVRANPETTPRYWADAARCLEEAGKRTEALPLLEKLLKEYPLSPEAQEAEKELARLKTAILFNAPATVPDVEPAPAQGGAPPADTTSPPLP